MSAPKPREYRFASRSQWERCLLSRVDLAADGRPAGIPALGLAAYVLMPAVAAQVIAADHYGRVQWRLARRAPDPARLQRFDELGDALRSFAIDGAAAQSPRWVAGRRALWAFCPGTARINRYDLATTSHDATFDLSRACIAPRGPSTTLAAIDDIAGDGRDGVHVLATDEGRVQHVIRLDCEGLLRSCWPVPCEAGAVTQIAASGRGAHVVLLGSDARTLFVVDAATGHLQRAVHAAGATCWRATRIASDARNRIALWGANETAAGARGQLVVLDGSGDVLDGPFDPLPSNAATSFEDLAIHCDAVWLGTGDGVWRVDASERSGSRESVSDILSPALESPPSDAGEGWLRAELDLTLPPGAVLEARVAGTDDERVADQARRIAEDRSYSTQRRQQAIGALLEEHVVRTLRIAGPTVPARPVAIPLFESHHRWLWLHLQIVTPPGATPPTVRLLRVLYPDLSLADRLPAMFRGEIDDPGFFLRRLVGVLETTTQQLDARIGTLGNNLLPRSAPGEWLDFLAGWLDLPWDDALPEAAKRAVLEKAGPILANRGTREGLRALLQALLGDAGSVTVRDITVDHPVLRLRDDERSAVALPALLAGAPRHAATLNGKAVVGRARLACAPSDCDPMSSLVPTVRVEITVAEESRKALQPILGAIVTAYVPAGVRVVLRWRAAQPLDGAIEIDRYVLQGTGSGALGHDAGLGRVVLAGRPGTRLDEAGIGLGFPLQ